MVGFKKKHMDLDAISEEDLLNTRICDLPVKIEVVVTSERMSVRMTCNDGATVKLVGFLSLAISALLLPAFGASVRQDPVVLTIPDDLSCASCSINIEELVRLGDAQGPGRVEVESTTVTLGRRPPARGKSPARVSPTDRIHSTPEKQRPATRTRSTL